MKRILILCLCAIIPLSLCACQQTAVNTESSTETVVPTEPATEAQTLRTIENSKEAVEISRKYLESIINLKNYDKATDENNGSFAFSKWESKEPAPLTVSKTISLDGHEIELYKTTFGNLVDMGFKIIHNDFLSPDMIEIQSGTPGVFYYAESEKNLAFDAEKDKDIRITGISFHLNEDSYCAPFSYEGISETSTIEDIIAAFGIPNHSVSYQYYEDDPHEYHPHFYLNYKTETMYLSFDYTFDPFTDIAALYTVSFSSTLEPERDQYGRIISIQ